MLFELKNLEREAENLLTAIRKVLDLTAPTVPQNVSGQDSGSTVTISWDEAAGAPDISHYKIYRDSVFLSTDDNSPYEDSSLANGTYSYQVTSVDRLGRESGLSTAVQVLVSVVPPHPDVPINFLASAASATGINLSWQRGPIDPAPTDYDLDYSTASSAGPWTNIAAVGLQTSFSHTALTTATQYWYRLLALNLGVSAPAYIQTTETTDGPAQVGAANFIISSNTTAWNGATARVPEQGGSARPVQPGDIIEIAARNGPALDLSNIVGSSANPIIIRGPSTGKAVIRSSTVLSGNFVTDLQNVRMVVFDGQSQTSTPDVDGKRRNLKWMYAINATGGNPEATTSYIKCSNLGATPYNASRDIVFKYIEIDGGWPTVGIGAGLGFQCHDNAMKGATFPTAWNENITVEHCYLHNLNGEGAYFGQAPTSTAANRGIPVRNINVRYNYIADTGGNPLDLKSLFGGTNAVHHNVIIRGGTDADPSTNGRNSISLISSKCDVYNNWIEGGGAGGVSQTIAAGTNAIDSSLTFTNNVYNNVIRNMGSIDPGVGIRCGADSGIPAAMRAKMQIFNNTVVSCASNGIALANTSHSGSWITNNVSLSNGASNISAGPGTKSDNLESGAATAILVDVAGSYEAGNLNLRLQAESLAVGTTGTSVAATDFDDVTRGFLTRSKGAYEFA